MLPIFHQNLLNMYFKAHNTDGDLEIILVSFNFLSIPKCFQAIGEGTQFNISCALDLYCENKFILISIKILKTYILLKIIHNNNILNTKQCFFENNLMACQI